MDLVEIGAVAGAILSIIALIKAIFKVISVINNLNNNINDLKNDVVSIKSEVQKSKQVDELQSNATRSMLRQDIIELTNRILKRGFIYTEEIYCLRKLFDNYKSLGGNSTVDERVKAVMKLPTKNGRFNPNKN